MSSNSSTRNVILIVILSVFLCCCLIVVVGVGLFAIQRRVTNTQPTSEQVNVVVQNTATSQAKPTALATVAPGSTRPASTEPVSTEPASTEPVSTEPANTTQTPAATLSPEIAQQMDTIQQQVISIRGLQPSGTFTRDVLTPDQLRQNTIRDFNKDNTPEDIRNQVIELSELGLLQPGFDLGTFTINLLSEQIAGYYDNKTKEMYVVGTQFGGMERFTYAHEYTHALQDENFDIQNGLKYDTQYCKQDSERCAGIQALLEGDAVQTQTDWFTKYATAQDYADIMSFYNTFKQPVYDSAPEYMKEDLTFPYDYGQKFVEYLYKQGGWAAVNAAYANVPVSTEQIMHPERYPNDKPVVVPTVTLTTTLGDGWQQIDQGVMGEWYTYLILQAGLDSSYRLSASTASKAAEGWGGDSYVAYYNAQTNQTVMALTYQWDTLQDADEFTAALVQYGTLRFGQPVSTNGGQTEWSYTDGYAIFRQTDQSTYWVMAPDQATAQSVWAVVTP